jgi:hypothetical protein
MLLIVDSIPLRVTDLSSDDSRAQKAESKYGSRITQFVGKDFYVDDGLISCATSDEAIKVMKDTQEALMELSTVSDTNLLNNNLPCKITGAKNPSGS